MGLDLSGLSGEGLGWLFALHMEPHFSPEERRTNLWQEA
jgi:hypothetical protein